ncbi:exosome complex exonuclease RRP46 homolog isoform X1 [Spinacia oleracea]|uniref:Exosome complex exonuclease RRP46 homolog isoform X1 n=1 Tax=Spinacia oleracea TaxID=3562 RepID=A0ABM3RK75_SPIOL|nr:exosome complex exonuclease RRP46 homolog isoform X1 [Spinacia oleracea]
MEVDREDGRTATMLRPLACSRSVLNRAHGSASWSQGDTKVLAAVFGPKAGTKKTENPEKASIEVIWKPKTGQIGKLEREYEMILKRTLQSICILTINPNTTTSVIIQKAYDALHLISEFQPPSAPSISMQLLSHPHSPALVQHLRKSCCKFILCVYLQVVNDDGALLPCAINAACAALVDAGISLKHLAVAICCCLAETGCVILDPTKQEEQKMKAFVYLVFPNSVLSVQVSVPTNAEPMEHGIITSVTHGAMSVEDYFYCLKSGRAATAKLSNFLRSRLQNRLPSDLLADT